MHNQQIKNKYCYQASLISSINYEFDADKNSHLNFTIIAI